MSREEASIIYIDNLLGFHGGYNRFQEAERRLSEKERQDIEFAVWKTKNRMFAGMQ